MSIIGGLLAFFFLDGLWRVVVIGLLLLTDVAEIALWLRWRKRRSTTGPEGMIGAHGRALTDCRPTGQVRVKGQIWTAHCSADITAGDDIVVTHVTGLRLTVAPR